MALQNVISMPTLQSAADGELDTSPVRLFNLKQPGPEIL